MTASCFPHPAELLETLLDEYGMDLETCAARARLDMTLLQDLLASRRDVDVGIALGLGRCFSGTQEVWLRHQAFHDSGLPSQISRDLARTGFHSDPMPSADMPASSAKRYQDGGHGQLP